MCLGDVLRMPRTVSVPALFTRAFCLGFALWLSQWIVPERVLAQAPRVSPESQVPEDRRLEPLKDLDGYFPFEVPQDLATWERRREAVRRQILVANGLWPMLPQPPIEATIHGRIERDEYTVERVYFESLPGFFVTGSLYRPKGRSGRLPAVLCPHGHWADGRFHDAGEEEAKRQIASGAEELLEAARSPLQARCVHLARMGYVVFHYDMIGYADSTQLSFDLVHRFAVQRPEMNQETGWGLFSPRAESRLQSVMGLQTFNSIRALDFVSSLPDVDAEKVAVTGASGGGTQSFILAAIDDRLVASFPAVMVSTAMQGGCTCENCSLLRVGTGNVEFAAIMAPKWQGLTAADDWTKEMETKGFPELRQLYGLYGAEARVELTARLEFGHNYNAVSRRAMYRLMQRAFGGGDEVPAERDFKKLTTEEMTVWNESHPKPESGDEFERKLMATWDQMSQQALDALVPKDAESLARFDEVVGGGLAAVLGRSLPQSGEVQWEIVTKEDRGDWLEMSGWLLQPTRGERIPSIFLYPKTWNGEVVLWFDESGKSGVYGEDGRPLSEVLRLVEGGAAVGAFDCFGQGEYLSEGQDFERTRRVANPREAAGYTFGYNSALFAQRAHDVMSAVAYVVHDMEHGDQERRISVIGTGGAGPLVAAASSQFGNQVSRVWVETSGFRFAKVDDLHAPNFLPGGARYFDLPGFLALGRAQELRIWGEASLPEPIAAVRQARRDAAAEVISTSVSVSEVAAALAERLGGRN